MSEMATHKEFDRKGKGYNQWSRAQWHAVAGASGTGIALQ